MEVRAYTTTQSFLLDAREFLYAQEAENGLVLGLAQSDPGKWDKLSFYGVFNAGKIVLAAFQSIFGESVFPLGLTNTDVVESVDVLFEYLKSTNFFSNTFELVGPVDIANRFASRYTVAFPDSSFAIKKRTRTHSLSTINPDCLIAGKEKLVTASKSEYDTVFAWYCAFMIEIDHHEGLSDSLKQSIIRRAETESQKGNIFLWVDDTTPVALSLVSRETDNVGTVSLVYTPPENRGKGYATRMVAHMAQHIQQVRKRKFVTLFTDLANPTSNSIYKKIGFEPLQDFLHYAHD